MAALPLHGVVAAVLLLVVCVSTAALGAAASPTSRTALIAVLTRRSLLHGRFRHVCGTTTPHSNSSRHEAQLPAACLALRGACRRTFSASLMGVAGSFDQAQLQALHACAGEGGIAYIASDGQVLKAEGSSLAYREWWTHRAPRNMMLETLQKLAASKLGAATAAGVAQGTANATAAGAQVQASDGPAHSTGGSSSPVPPLALLQRWLLAEVGMAAQQQLLGSDGGVVKAAGGPQEVAAADSAADGMQVSPGGSKNQDPCCIVVDTAAVARPGGRREGHQGWAQLQHYSLVPVA
jgi:hypothetical protein